VWYDADQMMFVPDVDGGGSRETEITGLSCAQCGAPLLSPDVVELDDGALRITVSPEGDEVLGTVHVNGVPYHVIRMTPEEFGELDYNLDSEVAEGTERFQTDAGGFIYVFVPYIEHDVDRAYCMAEARRWWSGTATEFTNESKEALSARYPEFADGEWTKVEGTRVWTFKHPTLNLEDLKDFGSCDYCLSVVDAETLDDDDRCPNCAGEGDTEGD
jgi:hypothetical protein